MGVPVAECDPAYGLSFRRRFNVEGRSLITIFGFVRPDRGYEEMLDILPELGKDIVLVIAGDVRSEDERAYLDELTRSIESRCLSKQIIVTGYLSDEMVAGAMQATEIALCPQSKGTGSYSVQIALAYGKPVLASDLQWFIELESESRALVTFVRHDREDLKRKIVQLLNDKATCSRLSANALDYAGKHSWLRTAEMTAEVYLEVVS
jgi:glycosyltransferase involved in cell wall biosynthesis